MRPVKNPAALLQKTRQLSVGEVIQSGDYITIRLIGNDTPLRMYELTDADTRYVNVVVGQYSAPVHRRLPKPDPMIAATKRIRAKTSLGKLEKLLAERATARRRVTTAITRLESIDNAIGQLARTLADASLESDLARINQTNTP